MFYGEEGSTAHNHENVEVAFKVQVFYVAIDQLIQEITRRSEKISKISNVFVHLDYKS